MEVWIVDMGEEVYGPFIGLTEATVFAERFQDRQRIRIRQMSAPHKLTYADLVNRVCQAQGIARGRQGAPDTVSGQLAPIPKPPYVP